MPENPLPVLKRTRSVEEKRPEIFHSPVEHEEAQQKPAIDDFERTMATARMGAFFISLVGLVLMVAGFVWPSVSLVVIGGTLMVVASLGRIEKAIQVSCCLAIQRQDRDGGEK